MSANKSIIIKKVIKKSGGGHHGGAWKVAYADFVTAMMAFFLLLWLLNMSSDEKRIRLSRYFKHFSIYTEGGTSFMGKSSEIFNESGESSDKVFKNPKGRDSANVENKKSSIETGISGELGGSGEQIKLDITKGGIRIQIIDKDGSEMFERGKNSLTPRGKKVLESVGKNIKDLPNKVSIEGHTDSTPVEKKDYGNWELSAERALAARRELQFAGLDSKRVIHVAGFADNSPLVKDKPSDPQNRRISIILHSMPEIVTEQDLMPPKYSLDNPAGNNIKLSTLVERNEMPPPEPIVREEEEVTQKKSTSQPVIKEDWIPVIDETDNQPVLDKGWSPVIKDETNKSAGQEMPPPPEPENKDQIIIDKTADIAKLPYIRVYGAEQRTKRSTVVQDLTSPVLPSGSLAR